MKLLLDTHIWIWAELEPERLSKRVASALANPANEIWLSPISVWELLLLVEKRRVKLAHEPHEWVDEAWSRSPLHEAPINRQVAMLSRVARTPQQDLADRFLAATAAVYDLTLVTADENLLRGKGYRLLPNR